MAFLHMYETVREDNLVYIVNCTGHILSWIPQESTDSTLANLSTKVSSLSHDPNTHEPGLGDNTFLPAAVDQIPSQSWGKLATGPGTTQEVCHPRRKQHTSN